MHIVLLEILEIRFNKMNVYDLKVIAPLLKGVSY